MFFVAWCVLIGVVGRCVLFVVCGVFVLVLCLSVVGCWPLFVVRCSLIVVRVSLIVVR